MSLNAVRRAAAVRATGPRSRSRDPSLLDPADVGSERALARGERHDDGAHRLGKLAHRRSIVDVQLEEPVAESVRAPFPPGVVDPVRVDELESDVRARRTGCVVDYRQEERVEPWHELRVPIDDGLDVLRVDVRAHDADRRVASAVDPQEGQRDGLDPRQLAARTRGLRGETEGVDVVAEAREDLLRLPEADDASLVVNVVADPRREQIEAADGADHLALRVD